MPASPAMPSMIHTTPAGATAVGGFLRELRAHLVAFRTSLRARRAYGDQLQAEVALDITADAARQQGRAGQLAYTAQQSDLEAARLLRESMADGKLTASDLPLLKQALRHIHRSAEADHKIGEALA